MTYATPIRKRWTQFTKANVDRIAAKPGRFEILLPNGDILSESGDQDVRIRLLVALGKYPKAKGFRVEY